MKAETIKTGKCPVCSSNEVYDNRGKSTTNHRRFILVSAIKSFVVDAYVCLNCGYFKEFISDGNMRDEKLKKKVREKWNKTDHRNLIEVNKKTGEYTI